MIDNTDVSQTEFYDTKQLAQKLDVTVEWLKTNRKRGKSPIPYRKIGPFVRYNKKEILSWIGRKDLELEFYSPQTLAKMLDLTVNWLNHNRVSNNPIPFRRFGRVVRYNKTEVQTWLNKQKQ